MGKDENAVMKPLSAEEMAKQLREKVKVTVQAAFVDLIPEEQWRQMVEAELEAFTKPQYNSYDRRTSPSKFSQLLQVFIAERFREMLHAELNKPEWHMAAWGNRGAEPGEAVKKLIKELLPQIIEAAYGQVIQDAVIGLRSSLSQG